MALNRDTNRLSLGSFNLIKGFAIGIIILGHISLEFEVSRLTWFYPLFVVLNFLKTPLIPLFFVISGYGFKGRAAGKTLKNSAKSLLIPYALVMLAFCVLLPLSTYVRTQDWSSTVAIAGSVSIAFLLGIPTPGRVLFGLTLSHCAIVWFLLALFWAHNILNLILKRTRTVERILLVLGCALLGYLLLLQDFNYFCIPQGLIATSYVYLGYVLKEIRLPEQGLPQKWMYAVWGGLALLYACWGTFDLCYGVFTFFPVDYVGVAILAVFLLVIGIHIGRMDWKVLDTVKHVGVYSYWILCIHSIEQKCLPWGSFAQLTEEIPNVGLILALIMKAFIIAGGCMMIRSFEKWNYRRKKKKYKRLKKIDKNEVSV